MINLTNGTDTVTFKNVEKLTLGQIRELHEPRLGITEQQRLSFKIFDEEGHEIFLSDANVPPNECTIQYKAEYQDKGI